MNHLSGDIKHLELFCDSCASQNKNYTMIHFLDFLINQRKRFDSIKISFPERGHSYLECVKDMGLINCKEHASTPSDWHEIFRSARKYPTPFNVIELKQDMVKSKTQFLKSVYKAGYPVPLRPLKEVMFSSKSPGVISHRDYGMDLSLITLFCPTLGAQIKLSVFLSLEDLCIWLKNFYFFSQIQRSSSPQEIHFSS